MPRLKHDPMSGLALNPPLANVCQDQGNRLGPVTAGPSTSSRELHAVQAKELKGHSMDSVLNIRRHYVSTKDKSKKYC